MKTSVKVLAALLAAASLGFASCKPQVDTPDTELPDIGEIKIPDDGGIDINWTTEMKEVAVFYGVTSINVSGVPVIAQLTYTFYANDWGNQEYKAHYNLAATGSGGTAARDYDAEKGTYTGDAKKNGTTLYLTPKQKYDTNQGKWIDVENARLLSFPIDADGRVDGSSGEMTLTLTRQ